MEVPDLPDVLDDLTSRRRNRSMHCTTRDREPQVCLEKEQIPCLCFWKVFMQTTAGQSMVLFQSQFNSSMYIPKQWHTFCWLVSQTHMKHISCSNCNVTFMSTMMGQLHIAIGHDGYITQRRFTIIVSLKTDFEICQSVMMVFRDATMCCFEHGHQITCRHIPDHHHLNTNS